MIDQLVSLFCVKFRNTEGQAPDYQIFFRISPTGEFQYGNITPLLNNSGACDLTGFDEGTEVSLPQDPADMQAYLLD